MPPIDLRTLDGTDGVFVVGRALSASAGREVSGAGDVNGDGFDDVLIGAPLARPDDAGRVGAAFVIYGKADGFPADIDLETLDATQGFRLDGLATAGQAGAAVAGAGDVNGDGVDDLIVGAPKADPGGSDSGEIYVVFGQTGARPFSTDLRDLDGADGFRIAGIDAGDAAGFSVAGVDDFNGDGVDDFLIGAPEAGDGAGEAYLVFGQAGGFPATLDLAALNGADGFLIVHGVSDRTLGHAVAGGDINGDGFADLIVGEPNYPRGLNNAHVVFGGAASPGARFVVREDHLFRNVELQGAGGGDSLDAGDFNGDGFDDVFLAAPRNNGSFGSAFILFGDASGTLPTFNLSRLNSSDGFRIDAIDGFRDVGLTVASAGDINADGFDDVLVGNPNRGQAYVVFGRAAPFDDARLTFGAISGDIGFRLDSFQHGYEAGATVAGAGDINGDGFDDIIIGSGRDSQSYIVFGFDSGAVTEMGSMAADMLQGGAGVDVLVGGVGDDVLRGAGGADVLTGGAGDDVIVVSDLTFAKINGGSGQDTLRIDSNHTLDLLPPGRHGLESIEVIDLNMPDARLIINAASVRQLSDMTDSLRVTSTHLSFLNLQDGGWELIDTDMATETYRNGGVEVVVDRVVQVIEENIGPVARDDIASAGEDAPIRFNFDDLLANDSDANIDQAFDIVAVRGGRGVFTLDAANREIDYDPNGMFEGLNTGESATDSAIYTIRDAEGAEATATLTVTILGAAEQGGPGDDIIEGGPNGDAIDGMAGDDILRGLGGDDRLVGNFGDDFIDGGRGRDVMFGGPGVDTLNYGTAGVGVMIDLAADTADGGQATGDRFSSFENVLGGSGADVLTGDAGANLLVGARGDDWIVGGAGADELLGGEGLDTLGYGGDLAGVVVSLATNTASGGDAAGDVFAGFENLDGGGGADRLTGDGQANRLNGGAGDDVIGGGDGADILLGDAGADRLDGGGGIDFVDFSDAPAAVGVNLASGFANDGEGGRDRLSNIENAIGSAGNDTLIGDDGVNRLVGGAGDDRIDGRGGADLMEGGAGDDIYTVDDAGDIVVEGVGEGARDRINVFVDYQNQDGVEFLVGLFADRGLNLTGSNSRESIVGANRINSGDVIDGMGGGDKIIGLVGDDVIDGGAGSDRIFGNSGDDVIRGGAGNDRVTGQFGQDRFVHMRNDEGLAITDFRSGEDALDLTDYGFSSFAEVRALFVDIQAGGLIDFVGADFVLLEGQSVMALGADDVLI